MSVCRLMGLAGLCLGAIGCSGGSGNGSTASSSSTGGGSGASGSGGGSGSSGGSGGSSGTTALGPYLGSCNFTVCTQGGVCEDFYSGPLPADPSTAMVQSRCGQQSCAGAGGGGPPQFLSSACPTAGRSGSCTIGYTQEVVRYYAAYTSTASAQTQCMEAGANLPGGSVFTPD